jgi:hypothetical protein
MGDIEETSIVKHLNDFLAKRQPPKTFCPSEVARALSAAELQAEGVAEWRELMPRIREIVWELRTSKELEVLQKGEVVGASVSLDDLKGPIRIRRVQKHMANAPS